MTSCSPAPYPQMAPKITTRNSSRKELTAPLLPPRDIYATLASTLAQPMDAQQY